MIISSLLWLLLTIIAMLVFHESGHYIAATNLGYKAKINWLKLETTIQDVYDNKHLISIYRSGVIAGGVPIIIYLFNNPVTMITGTVLLYYYLFVGVNKDLKELNKLEKKK